MLFMCQTILAQKFGQELIDSLARELTLVKSEREKADVLYKISEAYWYFNPGKGVEYAEQVLLLAKKDKNYEKLVKGNFSLAVLNLNMGNYNVSIQYSLNALNGLKNSKDEIVEAITYANLGVCYCNLGNLISSQQYCYKAIDLAEKVHCEKCLSIAYTNLAMVYQSKSDFLKAAKYYNQGLQLAQSIGFTRYIAANYHNLAIMTYFEGNVDSALILVESALEINKASGNRLWEAYNNNIIGGFYSDMGQPAKSIPYLFESFEISKELNELSLLGAVASNLGDAYFVLKEYDVSRKFALLGLKYAQETSSKPAMAVSYWNLSSLDTIEGNWKIAFHNREMFRIYNDSVLNDENNEKLIQQNMQFEFDKKEAAEKAVRDKKEALLEADSIRQSNILYSLLAGCAGLAIFTLVVVRQRNKVKKERNRSDELLLNILPEEVADELKSKGSTEAKQYDEVTVMFTDFKDFTKISETLSPADLVAEIHTCFKAFDNIISKFNIEKIKTIGDSYMCVGGLPNINTTNAKDVVNAALEIQEFMKIHMQQRQNLNKPLFEIRIGIHSGPVVAGIVGVKKFAYDIWGDTVNIASRMESSGEAGKINVSGFTYALIKELFNCKYRGRIQAKNKGDIEMYFVENGKS